MGIPSLKDIASRPRRVAQVSPLEFSNFKLGLNSDLPGKSLKPAELSMCVNYRFNLAGSSTLQLREGITKYTGGKIEDGNFISSFSLLPFDLNFDQLRIFPDTDDREWFNSDGREWVTYLPPSSGADEFICTQPDNKLYLLNSAKVPEHIATLQGDAQFIPFADKAIFCDSSYLKYWDKQTATVKMAYDDGTGENGYQTNNLDQTPDNQIILSAGIAIKAGGSFSTIAWDEGYPIPLTSIEILAKKVGNPTGDVGCEIYSQGDNVLKATSLKVYQASDISESTETLTFAFSSGELNPDTLYDVVLTYEGGDGAANYIQAEYVFLGTGGNGRKYIDGIGWESDTSRDFVFSVKPGVPPRAAFGLIQNNRLYLGGDPYKPGLVHFSNVNSIFDWSTPAGGGWIGVIDNSESNYPVSTIASFFNQIYIFGTQTQPFLCSLTGSDPSDYVISPIMQKIYTTRKTMANTANDIWFANNMGVNSLSGVNKYGDLRSFTESEKVNNKIVPYWDDSASFSGYNTVTGQFILKQTGYPRCLVAHTKIQINDDGVLYYPWTEYLFTRDNLTDTDIYRWEESGQTAGEFYLVLADGSNPEFTEPNFICFNDSVIGKGLSTIGSLSAYEWGFGDNDFLGYSSFYVKANTAGSSPITNGDKLYSVLEPTAFSSYRNMFLIAFDDGYIYELDSSTTLDNGKVYPAIIGFKTTDSAFNEFILDRFNIGCSTVESAATINVDIFKENVNLDSIVSTVKDIGFLVTNLDE